MKKIFLSVLLLLLLSACAPSSTPLIELEQVAAAVVVSDYPTQDRYDALPLALTTLLEAVNEAAEGQELFASSEETAAAPADMLHITLELEGGDLLLLNLYITSEEEGIIRCIRHTAEDEQIPLANFPFRSAALVSSIRELQSK